MRNLGEERGSKLRQNLTTTRYICTNCAVREQVMREADIMESYTLIGGTCIQIHGMQIFYFALFFSFFKLAAHGT